MEQGRDKAKRRARLRRIQNPTPEKEHATGVRCMEVVNLVTPVDRAGPPWRTPRAGCR
ncbi:MAG TPA: hypothetical protein VD969_19655 [Symbiobacteriaceae bacterium]|nr:hypothetical protein [Symbiobacteriaceae bacterium]